MKNKSVPVVLAVMIAALAFALFALPSQVQASNGQSMDVKATPGPWQQTLTPIRETLSALPTPDNQLLENLLVRERLALSNQQTRLSLAHTVSDSTQEYIDKQKAMGKDTSSLESALSAFNQAITSTEANNSTAAQLLANPAGFDASGQVVDRQTALNTLRNAGYSLRQGHLTITQATINLRMAVRSYRGK